LIYSIYLINLEESNIKVIKKEIRLLYRSNYLAKKQRKERISFMAIIPQMSLFGWKEIEQLAL